MSQYLTKTFAFIFAISAALICGMAFTAMTTDEKTAAPKDNTRSTIPAKSSRRIHTFLPDNALGASRKPLSQFKNERPFNVVNNKETEDGASERPLFLGQETRPTKSLMLGWVPAKDTNTTGPYQPGTYPYAWTKSDADCQTVDKTSGNAVEPLDGGGNGLHLPAGWLLGMCLHY